MPIYNKLMLQTACGATRIVDKPKGWDRQTFVCYANFNSPVMSFRAVADEPITAAVAEHRVFVWYHEVGYWNDGHYVHELPLLREQRAVRTNHELYLTEELLTARVRYRQACSRIEELEAELAAFKNPPSRMDTVLDIAARMKR